MLSLNQQFFFNHSANNNAKYIIILFVGGKQAFPAILQEINNTKQKTLSIGY